MIIKKQSRQSTEIKETASKTAAVEIEVEKEEKIDLFDIDNIDFSQRQERRRGDRRRGYRRIDDRNLISRAHEEADTIKDSAAKEGYRVGMEQAQKDINEIRNSIISFLSAKQEVFEYIAPDILEISVDIARKIIKKEVDQDPQVVLGTILDILKTISKDETRVSVKVHPSQLSLAKENIPEMVSSIGLDSRITVSADESIDIGGCMLYTSNGVVDATINTQIEIIKEALKGI